MTIKTASLAQTIRAHTYIYMVLASASILHHKPSLSRLSRAHVAAKQTQSVAQQSASYTLKRCLSSKRHPLLRDKEADIATHQKPASPCVPWRGIIVVKQKATSDPTAHLLCIRGLSSWRYLLVFQRTGNDLAFPTETIHHPPSRTSVRSIIYPQTLPSLPLAVIGRKKPMI